MKKVKVALSLLICIAICLPLLVSCGSNNSTNTSSSETPAQSAQPSESTPEQPSTGKSAPWVRPDGTIDLDLIAYYDPDYDYTQNERVKFKYIAGESPTVLHENVSIGFEHWCGVFNMQYDGLVSSNGDPDMYLSLLQNHLDQGYRGFVLDADVVLMERVSEIMSEYPDAAWMSLMVPPRKVDSSHPDDPGDLLNPWAGFDYYVIGEMYAEKLIEWKNETYPDVPWDEVAFLSMDASGVPPLHQRVISATARFKEILPESNIFNADTAAYSFSIDGAVQAATPIVTTNESLKYWLIVGLHDDFAAAAAMVINSVGLTDTSCIVSMGGPGFQAQYDAGQHDAFRYVLSAPEFVQCEVFIGAVYAFLNGWATPENIWPMWVNKNDCGGPGKSYANMRLPAYWISADDYQAFFQWSCVYAESDLYDYGIPGITRDSWPNRVAVPAEYNQ